MEMLKIKSDKLIIYFAFIISLVFLPINFDALIIPKCVILFSLSLYLLPELSLNISKFSKNRNLFFLFILSSLIVIQMLIVTVLSKAPFEQEFFGRTGRGLGITTFFSALIILLFMSIHSQFTDSIFILKWLGLSGLISSTYALLQRLGLDVVNWNSNTNGIIGTLGNPNFQSSFTVMAFIPFLVYIWHQSSKIRFILIPFGLFIFLSTLYFTQSTQGYITLASATLAVLLLHFWYYKKTIFYCLALTGLFSGAIAVAGMLNIGPLAHLLYKVSVQSRGDFWRAAFRTANANPIFGTGIDSFGDSFLIYRDRPKIEMTDNAHNYFLEFAATGGYTLAILYLLIIVLTFYSFFSLQKKINKFDIKLAGVFSAWLVFLLQAIISPGTITLILWNMILSAYLIGSNVKYSIDLNKLKSNNITSKLKKNYASLGFLVVGLLIMFPLFKTDMELKKAASAGDALNLMKALTSFPESSVKYNIFTQDLLKSGLFPQALEMGQKAVAFNSNSVSGWALIFVNPQAPLQERLKAKSEILRLDPMNTEVFKFKLD